MKNFKNKKINSKRAFTLVEILTYIFIFTIISNIVIYSLFRISSSYQSLKINHDINITAQNIISRLTYEVRKASNIDTVNSIFSNSNGKLVLLNKSGDLSTTTKISFVKINNNLSIYDNNDLDQGILNAESVEIPNLTLYLMQNTYSKAVKIDFTIRTKEGNPNFKSEDFSTTITLRNMY